MRGPLVCYCCYCYCCCFCCCQCAVVFLCEQLFCNGFCVAAVAAAATTNTGGAASLQVGNADEWAARHEREQAAVGTAGAPLPGKSRRSA